MVNVNSMKAPETTNLVPMTYAEALAQYDANGKRPFSFFAAPYGIVKTITVQNGTILASPPDAARAHYEWLALNRRGRS